MSDQCKHCTVRGDLKKCRATECRHHLNWYPVTLESDNAALKEQLATAQSELAELKCKHCDYPDEYKMLQAERDQTDATTPSQQKLYGYANSITTNCIGG